MEADQKIDFPKSGGERVLCRKKEKIINGVTIKFSEVLFIRKDGGRVKQT